MKWLLVVRESRTTRLKNARGSCALFNSRWPVRKLSVQIEDRAESHKDLRPQACALNGARSIKSYVNQS